MHKADLVKAIAKDTGLSQKDCEAVVNSLMGNIKKTLKKGGNVTLIGFGSFKVVQRKARKGRNPQTGKEIRIKASKAVKFTTGKKLKESVN